MGEIRQTVARLVATRDWSVAEQVRLLQLASDLDRRAPGVEAVFGESDTGDPWCVIKDADDDVLLHIARIGRNVIVHDVSAGLIQEGRDLWAILDRQEDRGDGVEVASDAVVVDLQQERRNAHFLLALVVAQAFGLDLETLFGDGAHAAEPTPAWVASEPGPALPGPEVDGAASDAHAAEAPSTAPGGAGAVTPSEAAGPPVARPADEAGPVRASSTPSAQAEPTLETRTPDSEAAQQRAPVRQAVVGGDGNDTLVGGPGADLILGNLGDDVLSGGGAPDGTADVLDGGSGDDQILVDKAVVAIGGRGADVFVVAAPVGGGDLGVVVDFDVSEGDILTFGPAVNARILTISSQDDILLGTVTATSLPTTSKVAGDRLGIDLDGDGVEDGYLLVANVKVRIAAGLDVDLAGDVGSRAAETGAPLLDVSQVI